MHANADMKPLKLKFNEGKDAFKSGIKKGRNSKNDQEPTRRAPSILSPQGSSSTNTQPSNSQPSKKFDGATSRLYMRQNMSLHLNVLATQLPCSEAVATPHQSAIDASPTGLPPKRHWERLIGQIQHRRASLGVRTCWKLPLINVHCQLQPEDFPSAHRM